MLIDKEKKKDRKSRKKSPVKKKRTTTPTTPLGISKPKWNHSRSLSKQS